AWRLWARAGDRDGRRAASCPGKARTHAVQIHGFSTVERAENADELFEIFECGGFFTENAARAVSTADAELHASARENVERGKKTCRDGHIANGWVRHAGSEAHFLRVCRHQCEERKRLHPNHMRVEYPAIAEAC